MWEWVNQLALERGVAAVSEGRCPHCEGRLARQALFEEMTEGFEELLTDPSIFARGFCFPCLFLVRAGHGGGDGRDWLSVTSVGEGTITTLTLNPPDEPTF